VASFKKRKKQKQKGSRQGESLLPPES